MDRDSCFVFRVSKYSIPFMKSYRELDVWKTSMELAEKIHAASKHFPQDEMFGLRSQIRRAAYSVPSNIAEGFERGGDKEFLQFLSTAKGSCGEVRSQLYVALDQSYITPVEFENISSDAVEVSRLVSGFMGYLRKSELRGNKFRRS